MIPNRAALILLLVTAGSPASIRATSIESLRAGAQEDFHSIRGGMASASIPQPGIQGRPAAQARSIRYVPVERTGLGESTLHALPAGARFVVREQFIFGPDSSMHFRQGRLNPEPRLSASSDCILTRGIGDQGRLVNVPADATFELLDKSFHDHRFEGTVYQVAAVQFRHGALAVGLACMAPITITVQGNTFVLGYRSPSLIKEAPLQSGLTCHS